MNARNLARLAILLWAVTVASFAWFFVKGSTSRGPDGRTAVLLAKCVGCHAAWRLANKI